MALFPKDTVIVHGACRGADMIADTVAKALGLETEPHPADWERYGRAAGPIRNDRMLGTGVEMVIAFHNDLQESKGTKNMVMLARNAHVPVKRVTDALQWDEINIAEL
jgi:hypothetical protein